MSTNSCSEEGTSPSTTAAAATTTTPSPLPSLPLPPPILSLTPGTWSYDTMSRRLNTEIFQRTYEENYDTFHTTPEFETALTKFNALRDELVNAGTTPLRMLDPLSNEDAKSEERVREWNEYNELLKPYLENKDTWLSAPWMVTEFYAYRLLMQAIGYYDKSNVATYKWDPFTKAKRAGLLTSVTSAENVMAKIDVLPSNEEGLGIASAFALWGNKMDLSLWPADSQHAGKDVFTEVLHSAHENLLHDDTNKLTTHCETLRQRGGGNVDIIVDNAGFELVMDLALADHLIQSNIAKVVTFQLKSHPTFVSDAMAKDLLETVEHYANLDGKEYPNARKAGERWQTYISNGQWMCHEDNFWVQPYPMWEMTEPLRSDMSKRCDLAFVKGDANYRRLLGDLQWDYTASFQDVVGCYFPCPVCALRTLKAEIGCGMDQEQISRAKGLDDEWMVNGRFGVVHFGTGAPPPTTG